MIRLRLPLLLPAALLALHLGAAKALAAPPLARQIPIDFVAPLLADDGSAYPSALQRPDAERAAGGPAPGWATTAQRNLLQRLHPRRVVRLDAADRAPAPARPLAADDWVFVQGPTEAAVRLARRVASSGVERVWVMLPDRAVGAAPVAQAMHGSRP